MKKFLLAAFAVTSLNAFAIAFITEAQVGEKLEAEKVIEVNPRSVQALLPAGSDCAQDVMSRSSRAYVIKKGNKSSLYLTSEDLDGLNKCTDL